jgi:hypothetical protein
MVRDDLYACFARRAYALFEIGDALVTSAPIASLPHLSLVTLHRRGWGSVYAALADGHINTDALRTAVAARPLAGGQLVSTVDVSVWPRCDAEASPERGYSYHPARHSAGQPLVVGWASHWLAQLGFDRDSWTAPVDARRVHPTENANAVAVAQIAPLIGDGAATDDAPLVVFDAGCDPVLLTQGLAGIPAAVLVRLRADRCFSADPPPAKPSPKGGRRRLHGAQFAGQNPATWPVPTAAQFGAGAQ